MRGSCLQQRSDDLMKHSIRALDVNTWQDLLSFLIVSRPRSVDSGYITKTNLSNPDSVIQPDINVISYIERLTFNYSLAAKNCNPQPDCQLYVIKEHFLKKHCWVTS